MSLDFIANIATIIGTVSIFITLIFVILELHKNLKQFRLIREINLRDVQVTFYNHWSEPHNAELVIKGSKDFDDVSQPMSGYEQYTPYGMQGNDQDATCTFNFGADSTFNGQVSAGGNSDANGFGNFKYSVPADHLCLCTRNIGS